MRKSLILLTMFFSLTVFSDDFSNLIHSTVRNNLNIRKAYYEVRKAEKLYKQASLEKAPSMKVQKIRKDLNEPIPTPSMADERFDVEKFILTSPIYAGGKLEYARKINGIALEIAKFNHRLAVESNVISVIEDYFSVMKLQKMLKVSREAREILQVHLDDVDSYFKNGLALDSDLLKIKVRISDVEKQIIEIENNIKLIKERILKDSGILPEFNLEKYDISFEKAEDIKKYLITRPEYEIISLKRRIDKLRIKVAEGEWKPSIYLTYENYSGNDMDDNNSGYSTSIVAEWKFYDFGKSWTAREVEEYSDMAGEMEFEEMTRNLLLEINCSAYNVEKSQALLKVSNTQVDNSRRNLEIIKAQFREGILKNSDFLDAQLEYTKSEMEYSSALYDLYVDNFRYIRSIGKLTEKLQIR